MSVDVSSEFEAKTKVEKESAFPKKFALGAGAFMIAAAGLLTTTMPDGPQDFERIAKERLLVEYAQQSSQGMVMSPVKETEIKMKAQMLYEANRALSICTIALAGGLGIVLSVAGGVGVAEARRKHNKNTPQP